MSHLAHKGVKRQLITLPTGTGKTRIGSQIPNMAPGKAMLWMAHRTELVEQAAESIRDANPELEVGIEQAKNKALPASQVVVASVQTLAVSPKRLESLRPDQFGMVVIDEAHHAPAKSYIKILHRFGLAPDPDDIPDRAFAAKQLSRETRSLFQSWDLPGGTPYLFGFTATPHRPDGVGLECVFDEIAFSRTIKEMIREGWLVDVRGVQVDTGVDISKVDTRRGDYVEGQLSSAVNRKPRNETAVNSFLALAADRQAICFCVDVKHTEAMCEAFINAGVKAAYVVGETPKDIRAATIAAYKRGDIQVLCNCMVFTEGTDLPATACIIMTRPTKSSLIYMQMMGRGLRLYPGKTDCVVIDLVDIGAAGVSTVNTLFGLPPKLALADTTVIEAEDELGDLFDTLPMDMPAIAEALTVQEVLERARAVDPLEAAAMPEWLDHRLAWVRTSYGYALNLQQGISLGIIVNTLGQATIRLKRPYHQPETVAFQPSEHLAVRYAESWVRENQPDAYGLLDRHASWRYSTDPPSQKQIDYLRWLKADIPEGLTKGQASDLINALKGQKVAM